MSRVVIFPVGKEAAADTYLAFVNDPENCPDAPFYVVKFDKFQQRVVGYLGPGGFKWNGQPFPEPVGGEAARADGILSDAVEWPNEE